MATTERITITLPKDLLVQIDQLEDNRSGFIAQAVRRELFERERAAFQLSLDNPHPESSEVAELGFREWAERDLDDDGLVDPEAGTSVKWIPGIGWEEVPR